ncbi:hypothetical protein [Halodesulfovibrio sp.]|uniref:hypothetical protein n=1 Tax=Halodesulfovibrio sp. TaxID=1912772 RepID=UPI0025BF4E87|nr:hypothetical protein [Halodesulfovibrio sp.]
MPHSNYNTAHFTIDRTTLDIEQHIENNGIWMERKEKDRLLHRMLSSNRAEKQIIRKQLPSISPTTELSFSEAGNDYGTYFTYKNQASLSGTACLNTVDKR